MGCILNKMANKKGDLSFKLKSPHIFYSLTLKLFYNFKFKKIVSHLIFSFNKGLYPSPL